MMDNNFVYVDGEKLSIPAPKELTDRASGSFSKMNVVSTNIGTRRPRHLARSYNANAEDDDALGLSEPLLGDNSVHYNSIYDSNEFRNQRNGIQLMRKRLKAHFMNPYEKFKKRGRKPWKLVIQVMKIILVTFQVIIFGKELFSVVTYMENSLNTFRHLFLLDYSGNEISIFTKDEFYKQVYHTAHQYYTMQDTPIGMYMPSMKDNATAHLQLCKYEYQEGYVDPGNHTYSFDRNTNWLCQDLPSPIHGDRVLSFISRNNLTLDFDKGIYVSIMASWIKAFHLKDDPICYEFNVTITFDNSKHDGKIPVTLTIFARSCQNTQFQDNSDDIKYRCLYIAVDILVILVCFLSFTLCVRSLYKHFKLVKATKRFFKQQLRDHLSYWDCLDLINLWFILIVISDTLTIIGSISKILIDLEKEPMKTVLSMYNACSICLGTGVLFTWISVLRYLGYMKKYNILLVTLRASGPSVLRFSVCAALLYFGFMFCGWIVLGPYHPKFRTLSTVSECMFSLINGDDMYMTFYEMQKRNIYVWTFSKLYLYVFISLFIYVVLSLFIGIISDTYERIKDWGHPPCTKLQRFVHGPNCQRCAEEYRDVENDGPTVPEE